MHAIDTQPMSAAFLACWQAAGEHLDHQVDTGIGSWLRAHPYPPFLDHLSFRLGNQLFFVRVEDASERVDGPGSRLGLHRIATACNGHACLLPMERTGSGGWRPVHPGWGLVDAGSGAPLDPPALVSDERIEMTDWELQDFAVQVVRESLEGKGYELMSWQANPEVDPSIWFVGDSGGPEWVVVRAARFPADPPTRPVHWAEIAASVAHQGRIGHFAPVTVMGLDWLESDTLDDTDDDPDAPLASPLWRGHALDVDYPGLETVTL